MDEVERAHLIDLVRTANTARPARHALGLLASWTSTPDQAPAPTHFIDAIARGEELSRARVSAVRFTPAARTAWHAHAVGQTLYVTEGQGLVQSRGGPVEEIRAGDVSTTPPDEWHWCGAAPDHYMARLSIAKAPGDDRPDSGDLLVGHRIQPTSGTHPFAGTPAL